MINVAELVDNLVALLRDIPELVAEMEGDSERIYAYHYRYPKESSRAYAILTMPVPGIMVAYDGSFPMPFGSVQTRGYRVNVYMRCRETFAGDRPSGYYVLGQLLENGIPTSAGVPLSQLNVHPSCMQVQVASCQPDEDGERLDYFRHEMIFVEM